MKETTLHSLITAKALFDDAQALCASGNTHSATAGLILLQDALELVLLAALVEKDIDDASKTEKLSFDQIIGDLRAGGVDVPKSGTLKSLNKNRVLAKHYGQLVIPEAVRGYLEASKSTIDSVLHQVVGKSLNDIFLTDLLDDGEAKGFLFCAHNQLDRGAYLDALIEIRKAIFVEIEYPYSVHEWTNPQGEIWGSLMYGGRKAMAHTRNKSWIDANVSEPTEFVQIDQNQLRADAVEWGVNTSELTNLRRLTPNVFRASPNSSWCVSHDIALPANQANLHNTQYCLDRAISIILKKQNHQRALRIPQRTAPFSAPIVYIGMSVFERADSASPVKHVISQDYLYTVTSRVTGFDERTSFYRIHGYPAGDNEWSERAIFGFLIESEINSVPFIPKELSNALP
jgi:hypothetical protein